MNFSVDSGLLIIGCKKDKNNKNICWKIPIAKYHTISILKSPFFIR